MTENYLAWLSNGQVFDLVLHPGAHFVSKLQPVVKPLLPGFHPHFIGNFDFKSNRSLFLSVFHSSKIDWIYWNFHQPECDLHAELHFHVVNLVYASYHQVHLEANCEFVISKCLTII